MNLSKPEQFIDILKKNKNKNMLVAFTRSTCPACMEYKKFLNKTQKSYGEKMPMVILDTEIFRKLAIENNIEYVPTTFLIKYVNNRKIVSTKPIVGLDPDKIEKLILSKINGN